MILENLRDRKSAIAAQPAFYPPSSLWLYGNVSLLFGNLAYSTLALAERTLIPKELEQVCVETEGLVLSGKILVTGIHNMNHQRAAIVPLRWGSPRIVVFSGGFRHHLGPNLRDEPFRAAKLWRYEWDPRVDLAVSLRTPSSKPTFALHNPTVDRLVRQIANHEREGLPGIFDTFAPLLHE